MLNQIDNLLCTCIWLLNSSTLKTRNSALYYRLKDGIVALRGLIMAEHLTQHEDVF